MILCYCRVSTDQQKERTSPEEQERVLRGYAMMRGAKSFDVAVFHDCISGSTSLHERPGGQELLATAKKGDLVVACKLDRLFRSACDALQTAEFFKEQGIDLVLVDMGHDPVTQNGPAKLFFTILSGVAEFERDRIAERILSGKRAKIANGGVAGRFAPFGWKKVGVGKEARIAVNEREQEVLRTIHELAKTFKPSEICKELEKREPRMRSRARTPFQMVQIQRLLQRPVNLPTTDET